MENKELIGQIRQRLEILYQMFEQLEQGGGGSPTDAYTKAETNALLNEKADKDLTYTKTETNTLLGAKANADSVYTKSETNAEIEGAITDLDVSSTATTGHYIKSIAQENGLIVPVAELADTAPTTGSAKLITSGAVAAVVGDINSVLEAVL